MCMEFQVEIVRLDDRGRGIGYLNGKIVFVEDALPQELVRVKMTREKKKYCEAKVVERLVTSKERVIPECRYYGTCGGCNLMHLSYSKQLEYKKKKGIQLFQKFAGVELEDVEIISSEPFYYRNKVVVHVEQGKMGYYQKVSHHLG